MPPNTQPPYDQGNNTIPLPYPSANITHQQPTTNQPSEAQPAERMNSMQQLEQLDGQLKQDNADPKQNQKYWENQQTQGSHQDAQQPYQNPGQETKAFNLGEKEYDPTN